MDLNIFDKFFKMRIILTFLASLVLFMVSYSQNLKKELTLNDAVMGYYKGLYPNNLYGINWSSNGIIYRKNGDELSIYHPTKKEVKNYSISEDFIKDSNIVYPERFTLLNNQSHSFHYNSQFHYVKNKESFVISYPKEAKNLSLSQNKKKIAFTIDNNLFIANKKDSLIPVTNFEDENFVAGQSIHRNEFGINNGIFWSNKCEKLAFYEKDETDVHDYPILDINQTPGELKLVKYPMAGQKSEYAKVGIYNTVSKKIIYLITEHAKDDYVTNLTWGPDDKFVYIAELNRDQNHLTWAQYDAENGKRIKTIYEEKNPKWVEPEHPLYFIPNRNHEFITLSERDGFMNIYHYNTDGKLLNQITNNKWVINSIKAVSNDKIYFEGTGNDPRSMHTYSVEISGKNLTQLTKEKGVHRTKISPDNKYLIDQWSNEENPGITQVISLKNSRKNLIHQAENPLKNYIIGKTEMIELSEKTDQKLYGRLIKPSNFDASKKYPVLVYVYGGPHAQLVNNGWLSGASLWMYWMAEQGYLIFTLDGRGSANRGFEFESSIFRRLGTFEMEDQLNGVEYLKTFPFVDEQRIAIHGWSFGGFMTTSLMTRHPGVFTTGVAGGPVIDWKWYEIMYGERYMDQPQTNENGYKEASLLNYVKDLSGNLLLIHGTADDVVVMQHNLAFVKKCVEEGKAVDFFPYPMHQHNVRGKDRVHLMKKVLNYILENNTN